MTSLSDEQKKLVETITEAFADLPYPGDDRLLTELEVSESPEIRREFTGKDWREISPGIGDDEWMHWSPDSLNWLSPEAFRYYLPAYLISCIEDAVNADVIPYTLISVLNPACEDTHPVAAKIAKARFEQTVAPLSIRQKRAISEFWRYALDSKLEVRSILNVYPRPIVKAFLSYWRLE